MLRSLISKYQEAWNSNRFINVLDGFVMNYSITNYVGVEDLSQSRYDKKPSTGIIKNAYILDVIRIGDKIRIRRER